MPPGRAKVKYGLAFKLSSLILLSTAAIFISASTYTYFVSQRIVLNNVEKSASNLALATACHIEEILGRIEAVPSFAAQALEKEPLDAGRIEALVRGVVGANPAIFASTVAFEPKAFDGETVHFAPYAYRSGNAIEMTRLGNEQYQYHQLDWYRIPKETNQARWSEPYFDKGGGNITMATYSVPFYREAGGERRFLGVVTVDIALDWLQNIMDGIHEFFDSGHAFILSPSGTFICHPNKSYVMEKTVFSLAEEKNIPEWREAGRAMVTGGKGFIMIPGIHFKGSAWMAYTPLPSARWSLGVIFPAKDLFRDVIRLTYATAVIGLVGVCLLFLLIVFVAVRITGPLRDLSDKTSEIAKGNLDVPLPMGHNRDEVGALSQSFADMRAALKEYIRDLTETTAEKERIESELKIAHSIQMSFLPCVFPPFPEHLEFRLHAAIEPAREVGGDLYDFFLVDNETLFFTIGDVAGKGVPAALFMAVTKTLMKGAALHAHDPAVVLEGVNKELCQGNDANLFVTIFCGCLNFRTGELRYSNAGHNPPLVVHPDGAVHWLELPRGLVLGVQENNTYTTRVLQMPPGSRLIAYTDGVTEAINQANELYSNDRLLAQVRLCGRQAPREMVMNILESVHEFADGSPQSDDITVLVIEFT